MTPIARAHALHSLEAGPRSFREDLEAHLKNGIVFNTPTAFVMARYVSRSWPDSSIINPWVNDATCSQLDCLHVYLAAGDLTEFFTFPHKPAKWVSFERKNHLKFYLYERISKFVRQDSRAAEVPTTTEGRTKATEDDCTTTASAGKQPSSGSGRRD